MMHYGTFIAMALSFRGWSILLDFVGIYLVDLVGVHRRKNREIFFNDYY